MNSFDNLFINRKKMQLIITQMEDTDIESKIQSIFPELKVKISGN